MIDVQAKKAILCSADLGRDTLRATARRTISTKTTATTATLPRSPKISTRSTQMKAGTVAPISLKQISVLVTHVPLQLRASGHSDYLPLFAANHKTNVQSNIIDYLLPKKGHNHRCSLRQLHSQGQGASSLTLSSREVSRVGTGCSHSS